MKGLPGMTSAGNDSSNVYCMEHPGWRTVGLLSSLAGHRDRECLAVLGQEQQGCGQCLRSFLVVLLGGK